MKATDMLYRQKNKGKHPYENVFPKNIAPKIFLQFMISGIEPDTAIRD